MRLALTILGLSILLAAGVGIYLYPNRSSSDVQPQYSEAKKAAMAARAANQAAADVIQERMIEAVSANKSSMKEADMKDVLNPRN